MITSMNELLKFSKKELDALYTRSETGPIPNGVSKGKAIVLPGTFLRPILTFIGSIFWQGKVFNRQGQFLLNRLLGCLRTIKADVYLGPSWLDGKECININYEHTSFFACKVFDEIRCVSPGIYLGLCYWRSASKPCLLYFVLDFNK